MNRAFSALPPSHERQMQWKRLTEMATSVFRTVEYRSKTDKKQAQFNESRHQVGISTCEPREPTAMSICPGWPSIQLGPSWALCLHRTDRLQCSRILQKLTSQQYPSITKENAYSCCRYEIDQRESSWTKNNFDA
ncbi:hypothetical protein ABVK25_001477 [Lepraria finkii]|uniref:Uncharacterized protein n=1 Tax=Lepraria finkii TaxID=1340010 RepID=A0ABR4BJ71_9LECA